jgi:hypothetical protein
MHKIIVALLAIAILGICALLITNRYEMTAGGPRNMLVMVRDKWTGTISVCVPRQSGCDPIVIHSGAAGN